MNIAQIAGYGSGGLLLLLALIEVTPLKVNPLSYVLKKIGRQMNAEIFEQMAELKGKIDAVDSRVDDLAEKEDRKSATLCRARILRFGDEVLHGVGHSKEHYDQILLDITDYSQYCDAHPEFANHVTKHTEREIEDSYQRLLETNGFL